MPSNDVDEELRKIHNRFHGRFETHAEVAKRARWTDQELENVQIENEWLMYQELTAWSDRRTKAVLDRVFERYLANKSDGLGQIIDTELSAIGGRDAADD